ncbi:MAG: DsrE family protein [Hydrogenothermaceae bacterium]
MKKVLLFMIFQVLLSFYSSALAASVDVPKLEVDTENFPEKMKAVFDWSLDSPEEVPIVLIYISNYIKAYQEYYPMAEYKIAVVSHGGEAAIFAKKNYEKFKEAVDRMKSLSESYGVKFYVCKNVVKALGFEPEDLQPFIILVPAGVLKVAELQEKGYRLIPTVVRKLDTVKKQYGK